MENEEASYEENRDEEQSSFAGNYDKGSSVSSTLMYHCTDQESSIHLHQDNSSNR